MIRRSYQWSIWEWHATEEHLARKDGRMLQIHPIPKVGYFISYVQSNVSLLVGNCRWESKRIWIIGYNPSKNALRLRIKQDLVCCEITWIEKLTWGPLCHHHCQWFLWSGEMNFWYYIPAVRFTQSDSNKVTRESISFKCCVHIDLKDFKLKRFTGINFNPILCLSIQAYPQAPYISMLILNEKVSLFCFFFYLQQLPFLLAMFKLHFLYTIIV